MSFRKTRFGSRVVIVKLQPSGYRWILCGAVELCGVWYLNRWYIDGTDVGGREDMDLV